MNSNVKEIMDNTKHYPTHPGAEHPPIMTCEIPLEEYESLKRENAELKDEIKRLENVRKVHIESIESMCEGLKLDAKQICKTQRALWLARANRALEKIAWFKLWNASISTMNPEDGARQEFDKWKKNLGKFLSKAEEYE